MESKKRGRDEQGHIGEKRQRIPQPEQRIILEKEKVSYVIGKGGAIIKNIIKQSGAFLKFSALEEGTPRQVGAISGPPESIATALELLIYQVSKFKTSDGQTPNLVLLVPSSKIGSIIGKSGQVVRSIYAQSGAKIQISSRPETSPDSPPVDQEVNVQGKNAQSVAAAVRILLSLLFHTAPSFGGGGAAGPSFAGGPSYGGPAAPTNPYWPPAPVSHPPSLRPDQFEIRFALRPAEVSKIIGKGGQGIQSLCKQTHVNLIFDKQTQQSIGGPTLGPGQVGTVRGDVANIQNAVELIVSTLSVASPTIDGHDDSKSQTVRFLLLVPTPLVGFLLGTKGTKMKETKAQSGAQINITGRADAIWDHVSGVALQATVIEGTAEQVTIAVKSLVAQLDDARQGSKRGRREVREEQPSQEAS